MTRYGVQQGCREGRTPRPPSLWQRLEEGGADRGPHRLAASQRHARVQTDHRFVLQPSRWGPGDRSNRYQCGDREATIARNAAIARPVKRAGTRDYGRDICDGCSIPISSAASVKQRRTRSSSIYSTGSVVACSYKSRASTVRPSCP